MKISRVKESIVAVAIGGTIGALVSGYVGLEGVFNWFRQDVTNEKLTTYFIWLAAGFAMGALPAIAVGLAQREPGKSTLIGGGTAGVAWIMILFFLALRALGLNDNVLLMGYILLSVLVVPISLIGGVIGLISGWYLWRNAQKENLYKSDV